MDPLVARQQAEAVLHWLQQGMAVLLKLDSEPADSPPMRARVFAPSEQERRNAFANASLPPPPLCLCWSALNVRSVSASRCLPLISPTRALPDGDAGFMIEAGKVRWSLQADSPVERSQFLAAVTLLLTQQPPQQQSQQQQSQQQ